MQTRNVIICGAVLLSILNSPILNAFAQGDLTPSGAPTPTMKTLAQVEPRTPVNATHTPGDGSALFIINKPGSYYLTTNVIGVIGKDGIKIATNNVMLDLNGFSLVGIPTSTYYAIYILNSYNVTVRNGMVSGWTVEGGTGIASFGNHVTLEGLTISSNSLGIHCFGSTVIRDCTINGNAKHGIYLAASDCLVVGNNCIGNNTTNNAVNAAIHVVGSNNRIEGNHVTKSGVAGKGISISLSEGSYTNNILIRNSVKGGGANNYSFGTSQIIGPVITNTLSGIITNSNPWANFSF